MTQGPWSIKGIDPRARSAARDQAQRRGVTLGQYLNSLLLDEEPVRVEGVEIADFHASEADPEDMRRMSREIDLISQRIEAAQARNARALAGVDKSILGVMGRLETTNKAQLGGLERVARALSDIEQTQAALRHRIEYVETQGHSGQTVAALKALEASLSHLAETVQERDAQSTRQQAELHDLFDQKVSRVSERVEHLSRGIDAVVGDAVKSTSAGLSGRMEQIEQQVEATERRMEGALDRITDAASRFELFESKAERAVTDTTWRMERALDASVQRSRAMSKDLLDRVDGIEEKTRDAIGALGDAVARITERIGRAERSSGAAITALERSVTSIDDRFAKVGQDGGAGVAEIKTLFQKRLDTLAEDLSRPIHAVRQDVERRVEEALRTQQPEKLDRLEATIRQLQRRIEETEGRQAGAVETISSQVDRMSRAVDERLRGLEGRSDERSIEDVRHEMMRLADTIDARLDAIETADRSSAAAVDRLAQDVGRASGAVDQRIHDSERRSAGAIDAVGEQVAIMAERLQRRHDESIQRLSSRIEEVRSAELSNDDFNRFAQSFDERVRESERRSAEAIGQIGEQVARAAERLQNQHLESLRMLETRLADSGRAHENRLSDALADITRRMDEVGEQSSTSLNPVHKTVSSLARRLAALEDGLQMEQPRVAVPLTPAPATPSALIPERAEAEAEPLSPPDDFLVLEDEPLKTEVEPALAAGLIEAPLSEDAEIKDIIGVDPPPFDRTPDARLFAEEPAAGRSGPASAGAELAAPARNIDDLLDIDDLVLAQPAQPPQFVADLPDADMVEPRSPDYLAAARRAAREGRRVPLASAAAPTKRGIGKGPLIASAALAVAVAGGSAYTVMRGKQDPLHDAFAKLSPQSPKPVAGDPKAAAAMLFGDDHGAKGAAPAPTAPAAAPTASVQAEAAKPAEPDIFEPTPPWKDEAKGASAGAAAASAKAPPVAPAPHAMTLEDGVAAGDPVALYDKSIALLQTADKGRAVSMMKEAAGKGLVMAQYRLAKLYEKGEGMPRDMAQSRAWTEKAAMGGNIKAMHDLAVFYAEGDAGPQSYAAAVEWFRQAADLGLVDSQYNLAVLYDQGLGVSQDKAEAAFWYETAARSGDPDGSKKASVIEANLAASDVEQIKRRSRSFTPKSGIARANGDLGKRPWDAASPAQIAEEQRLLEKLGYAPGKADGHPGGATLEAIRRFEKDNGLAVTGETTLTLLQRLKAAAGTGG